MSKANVPQVFGLQELHLPSGVIKVDIVAVHGLNGDAHKTWTSQPSGICWLNHPNLLPKYVPEARILTWGYNANVTSLMGRTTSSDRILQHAQTLIADLCADRELEDCVDRPIIFLCHSLGGIVVKRALSYSASRGISELSHLHSISTCTFAVLFFGTPHHGSSKAHLLHSLQKLASLATPRSTVQFETGLLAALEIESETLQNITNQFTALMTNYRIFFFWEQEKMDLKYSKDYIVDESSAAPMVANTERCGIAADHREMCRFERNNAPAFRIVVAAIKRYSAAAPESIRVRWIRALEVMEEKRKFEAMELLRDMPPIGSTVENSLECVKDKIAEKRAAGDFWFEGTTR